MGFCLGVEEAVTLAYKVAEENPKKNIYILGMLVHNKEVIFDLQSAGIKTVSEEEFVNGLFSFV